MMLLADTLWIVDQAKTLGFDLCGVVRAEKFPELEQMPEWLARGYAGEMKYLADPRRSDPQKAMPGIRSVIVCLLTTTRSGRSPPILPCQSITASHVGGFPVMPGAMTTTMCCARGWTRSWNPCENALRSHSRHELTWTRGRFRSVCSRNMPVWDGSEKTRYC